MAGGALSFREDPFRLMPDRRFIFSTDGFRRAFEGMLDGFRVRRGIVLLTGPSGCGKTTLLQALQEEMQRDGAIVFVRFHPEITGDLLTSCLAELGSREIPVDESARVRALIDLVKLGTRAGGPPAVLVIDEAGQFSDAQLIDLYRLTAPGHPLSDTLQIVLAALPIFEQRLQQNGLATLQQVIGHRARLQPLSEEELSGYIAHRCSVAGLTTPDLFEKAAVKRVYEITRGTPRLVNRLCSGALFVAREQQSEHISAEIIDEAAMGCELAGMPVARPAEAPLPSADKKAAPAEAAAPQPAAAASQQPKPQAVQAARPRMPAAATPDALALAEAERAWVKAILPPIAEAPAKPDPAPAATPRAPMPVPPPAVLELTQPAPPATPRVPTPAAAPAVLELTQPAPPASPRPPAPAAAPAVLELTQPAPPILELSNPIDEAAPAVAARRRLPALRIAASIALVATSATALGLWYRSTGDHAVMATAEPAVPEISRSAAAETRTASASDVAETPAPVVPPAMAAAPEPAPAAAEPASQPPVTVASSDTLPAVQTAAAIEPVAPSEPAAAVPWIAESVATPPPVVKAEPPAPEPQQVAEASQPVVVEPPNPATAIAEAQPQPEPPPSPSAEAQPQQVAQAPEPAAAEAQAPATTMAEAAPQAEPPPAASPQQLPSPPAATESPAPATTVAEAQPQPDPPPAMPETQALTQADVPPRPEPTEIAVGDAAAPQPAASAAAVEPAAGRDAAAPIADPPRSDPATAETRAEPPPAEPARSALPSPATPAPEPAPAQAAAPTQVAAAEAPRQTAQVGAAPVVSPVDAAELSRLMARGDEMMRIGDPASARLFYERAAARGLAKGFTAVGRTYDPTVLRQLNIRGGGANGERALEWYRRGADAGDTDAGKIASDLSAWLARPR